VSGTVTAVNNELLDHPEVVNTDPYGQGWLFKLSLEDKTELEGLLDADEYDASMPDDE
jgi:glycine cleavage system H protein